MKKGLFLKLLPHLVAVAVFLLVAVLYCQPALEGKVVNQSDVTHWKGSIHQSEVYRESHGEYPLWTNALFSGMPTVQIGMPANNLLPWRVYSILTLGLPIPIQFFFLACICFYFLCCVVRINPYIGIFGSLAFGYATYNPVIIAVGHETKMWSIAFMPALLASILLLYERRKYWLGAALTGLFTATLIAMNHPQIDYYFFLVAAIMTIFYLVRWVRAKEFVHAGKALGLTLAAAVIGVLINAVTLFSTLEYQKRTIRGGVGELAQKQSSDAENGLTKDYALDYSMSKAEPFVMMVPKAFGGSSGGPEIPQEESKAISALQTMPKEAQDFILQQNLLSYYWGGIGNTSGPPYVGALVCLLAIIGFFILDNRYRWWILACVVLSILMSWGKYFLGFNSLLYQYLPLYNKFRAPSMILVIPQLLLPLLAALAVNKVANEKDKHDFVPYFKKGLIAVGVIIAILLLGYFSFDYKSPEDEAFLKQLASANQPQVSETVRTFYESLVDDRKSLFISSLLRTIGFCVLGTGVMYLMVRKVVKPVIAGSLLALVVLLDLLPVDSTYLNSESYLEPTENDAGFQPNEKDQAILAKMDKRLPADSAYFRVFNLQNPFNENFTPYLFNAIGGYHPAKLRTYQELIENELSQEASAVGNILQTNPASLESAHIPALNMLNTRYVIAKHPNTGVTSFAIENRSAMGPAWLVRSLRVVKSAKEEMAAFATLNPRDTAVMQQALRNNLKGAANWSGQGTIKLDKNDNDVVEYSFSSNEAQFAVFSEVYYDAGWKAFIDGKETPILKVNYVLRGLQVPAGAHKIVFRFEPQDYLLGRKLTTVFQIVLLFLIAAAIFFEWRNRKTLQTT